jgi:hypothetical protein
MSSAFTRREFFGVSSAWGIGAALGISSSPRFLRASGSTEPAPRPLVVRVRSDDVIVGGKVHPGVLRDMVGAGLRRLTGRSSPAEAWRSLLAPDDVIGLKFDNGVAPTSYAEASQTALALTMVRSLLDAGYSPEQIVPIATPDSVHDQCGTKPPPTGWVDPPATLSGGPDRVASVLQSVTALVNVPKLRPDDLSVMAGCLYNISLPLVEHPARHFANGCSPAIAEIAALDLIRSKLRLNIVDALWLSPLVSQAETAPSTARPLGTLLFGCDPVATDRIAFDILSSDRQTQQQGTPNPTPPAHLADAVGRELGCYDIHKIKLEKIVL